MTTVLTLPPLVMHVRVVSGHGGGPDKTILNSPRYLERLGYRSVCVYLRDPADSGFPVLADRAAEKRAPLVAVDDFGIRDWKLLARVSKLVDRDPPAIWHGHDYKSNLVGLLVNRQRIKRGHPPMRLVTTVHGWVHKTWKTPLYYFIDRQCLPRYEQVICVSRDLHDDCLRIGVPPERLSLIDNAIALDDYEFGISQAEARAQLCFHPQRPLIAAVGRLSAEKAFDRLIDAVVALNRSGTEVGLAIAGSGVEQDRLQERAVSSGLIDRIHLLGYFADPRLLYQAADLFVLSSLREGLPNVVLEAMAMRKPVIATRIAGLPNIIQDGVNGRLIEPNNTEAIQNAIAELLAAPDQRTRLAEAGRQTIEDRYSFDKRMEKIKAVYEK